MTAIEYKIIIHTDSYAGNFVKECYESIGMHVSCTKRQALKYIVRNNINSLYIMFSRKLCIKQINGLKLRVKDYLLSIGVNLIGIDFIEIETRTKKYINETYLYKEKFT